LKRNRKRTRQGRQGHNTGSIGGFVSGGYSSYAAGRNKRTHQRKGVFFEGFERRQGGGVDEYIDISFMTLATIENFAGT
jgi:hypothetical protein